MIIIGINFCVNSRISPQPHAFFDKVWAVYRYIFMMFRRAVALVFSVYDSPRYSAPYDTAVKNCLFAADIAIGIYSGAIQRSVYLAESIKV